MFKWTLKNVFLSVLNMKIRRAYNQFLCKINHRIAQNDINKSLHCLNVDFFGA